MLALGALASACEPDPEERVVYAAYEGEAFPDRVPPVAWPSGPAALVTDSLSDTISVVDLTTGARVDQRPVGRNPVDIDGPHHLALDSTGRVAFVGLSYPNTKALGPHATHGSSATPGYVQKLSLDDLSILGQVRVDPNPGDVVISVDGARVVVSHFDLQRAVENPTDLDAARATVAVIDPDQVLPSGSPRPTFVSTCVAPHGMALSRPTGSTLFVACYGEDRLAIVDLDDPSAPVERVDVGPGVVGFGAPAYGPYVALLSPDGSTVAVSNTASKDVRFFDVETRSFDLDRTITTLGAPFFPVYDATGRYLAIPTQQPDALVLVDLEGVEPTRTRDFVGEECVLPHAVEVDGDGWVVVCEGDKASPGRVVRLDPALELRGSAEVGLYPDTVVRVDGGVQR